MDMIGDSHLEHLGEIGNRLQAKSEKCSLENPISPGSKKLFSIIQDIEKL